MPARLILPSEALKGTTRYWGAGCHSAPSTDGSWFYAFQDRPGVGRVMQRHADGRQELIPLTPQPTARPTLYAGPSGLFVTAGMDGDDSHLPCVWQIEGYVWPGPAGGTTDATARAQLTQLQTAVQALTTRTEAVERRPVGVSQQQVEAIAWSKANDALYAQTRDANSVLAAFVWQKAKDAAYALLREAGLIK
jgi:hypothetical protein